ncbi:MAG: hypothetical protein WCP45_05305 [Verrucomicrobiota bacterium]
MNTITNSNKTTTMSSIKPKSANAVLTVKLTPHPSIKGAMVASDIRISTTPTTNKTKPE